MSARAYCALGVLLSLAMPVGAGDAPIYSVPDDDGVPSFGDSLSPRQVGGGYEKRGKDGTVKGTVPPVKTLEETLRDQELQKNLNAAERARQEQRAADRRLLLAYGSVADMVLARDGNLASIDANVQGIRSNIRRQQDWLVGLRADAASLERVGKPIPQQQSDGIGNAERAIRDAYSTILAQERQKQEIHARFAVDIKRFRQLKNEPEVASAKDERGGMGLPNVVPCPNAGACERAWTRATAYVRARAMTPIQASGADILITAPAEGRDDVSLTLTRIQAKDGQGASLFLDAQCKPDSTGLSSCTSPAAKAILEGFHDAVGEIGGGPGTDG